MSPDCLAVRPFRITDAGLVIDANGSTVLACSEVTDCPLRFAEREVEKDGHFICPNCGRLGQRMVEATPEQCGIINPDNPQLVRPGDRLLIAITFPPELDASESCHPDIVLEDFLGSRNDPAWNVEVYSVLPKGEK